MIRATCHSFFAPKQRNTNAAVFLRERSVVHAASVASPMNPMFMADPPLPTGNKWVRRGAVLAQRGDYIGAISAYSQALIDDPRNADAYVGRGKAFKATRGFDLALGDFNAAVRHNSKCALAFAERGKLYCDMSVLDVEDRSAMLDSALLDLNHALELDPNCYAAYQGRAAVYSVLEGDVNNGGSRGSRAVHDAYMALQLGYVPAAQ